MITPIDVIDSAVKIGLGALISGLATYWLAKANHNKTVEKERAQRRRDLLEGVTQQIAVFEACAINLWQAVITWVRFTPATEKMSEETRTELGRLQAKMADGSNEINSALAKLLLLGELECHKSLREYATTVKIYHTDAVAARRVQLADLQEDKEKLGKKKEEFFAALSKIYIRI